MVIKSAEQSNNQIENLEKIIKKQADTIELLEAAINSSEVGFTISDASGKVIKINDSQVRITGHHPSMTLGRSMADIEVENRNKSATMQIVKSRQAVTIEQILPSGKSYLVYGQPYFDTKGTFKYIICNIIDNTEHNYIRHKLKRAEEDNLELKETISNLQVAVEMQKSLVYCSTAMKQLVALCDKIAPFNSTVLITGESGTGKEMMADYIFQKSSRFSKPFIKINCAAIPEALLESELFGYEPGAFTNASKQGKKGIFEMANGGTVMLDEIGELPLHLQSKILRVLQDGEFFHVGGTSPIYSDIRIIAATNRNLEEMTVEGTFRKDLYYRLSVIQIQIPPLNERKEDIPPLINYFIKKFNEKHNLHREINFEALKLLSSLPYEGNIRDLQNTIEKIIILVPSDIIDVLDVKEVLNQNSLNHLEDENEIIATPTASLKELVSQFEKKLLEKYWNEYGSASAIAKILQTNQPTISRKLHEYKII